MKIIHLAESMDMGGAETLIGLLCRSQREQGHDSSVHCLYRVGCLGEQLRAEGVEVVLYDATGAGGRARDIYRALKSRKPDVVHCHNATATIYGSLLARAAGARRVIATRHGMVAPPYSMRRELKFAAASRWCDWIVAVCEQARNNLMAAPFASRARIVRIYNGIDALAVNGSAPPAKSGFTALHVARLSEAKDQKTLLRAFALAKSRVLDLHLWIVGGGEMRSTLEHLAHEMGLNGSVTFFGEQEHIGRFFAAADMFVLSSITEGLPVSLLEAMAAGLPAVVTEVGGMGEVARLSDAAIAIRPADPDALAGAIVKLAQDRHELPRLGRLAQECHRAKFTLERMAREYMSLYSGAYS